MTEEELDERLQEIADLKKRVSDLKKRVSVLEYLNSAFYEDDLK